MTQPAYESLSNHVRGGHSDHLTTGTVTELRDNPFQKTKQKQKLRLFPFSPLYVPPDIYFAGSVQNYRNSKFDVLRKTDIKLSPKSN